jgi:reversibly glycosylated polypeptide/UDP-arabinopyranose mutase
MQDVVIVVPTIREKNIQDFLARWNFDIPLIIIEDNPEPTFQISGVTHYSWQDIEKDLGKDSWIIPRRSDCVRSYGYWKAYQTGAKHIITLDDDCYPVRYGMSLSPPAVSFVGQHVINLLPRDIGRWYSTLENPVPRGVPYEALQSKQQTGISHGLWENVPDYDSISQLVFRRYAQETRFRKGYIPHGVYYPMCGMNLAWHRDVTPLLYFLLMGQDDKGNYYQFDRFGDIWAGILSKKVLDHFNVTVYSGNPVIHHDRASNVWANYRKEHIGILENETFWHAVDSVQLTGADYTSCYQELAQYLPLHSDYWKQTRKAMHIWANLFQ